METAVFSLINYRFSKISIDFSDTPKNTTWNINILPSGFYDEKSGIFKLAFNFLGVLSKASVPNIEVVCNADFQFEKPLKNSEIPEYFYRNCIAILFPYVRAFVSTVTLQANIPPVILPTYNLSSLSEKLMKNTEFAK